MIDTGWGTVSIIPLHKRLSKLAELHRVFMEIDHRHIILLCFVLAACSNKPAVGRIHHSVTWKRHDPMNSMLARSARSLSISTTKRQRQQVAGVVLGRIAGWRQVRGAAAAAAAGEDGRLRRCKDSDSVKSCGGGGAVAWRRLLHSAASATDKEAEEVGSYFKRSDTRYTGMIFRNNHHTYHTMWGCVMLLLGNTSTTTSTTVLLYAFYEYFYLLYIVPQQFSTTVVQFSIIHSSCY